MSLPPNATLYIRNLNDIVKKEELRAQLYALFSTYGKIIDVVAQKGAKKRGQAFVVFRDLAGATSALRSLDGELFYDKKMQIEYARTPSHATLRHQDPNFVPPKLNQAMNAKKIKRLEKSLYRTQKMTNESGNEKTTRRREAEGDDMEVDDDDEGASKGMTTSNAQTAPPIPSVPLLPSAILLCQNLPAEVTDDVLAVLFQQYSGFQGTKLSAPDPATKSKTAHVRYDTADQATVALEALDHFQIKRGWNMRVSYAFL
ncbi:hypothetical protein BS47DRAFT_1304436 [Hydnum rufescens UP504]|uniref:RRM domain-containing protein n=1 Tax=Hydnum rufescens UP504 TaxID=1448309 RepID=A0A9P6DQ76_9AGAM|nr:hypothetical protein BS47DRAFT_1304436 [Hydnum rufescens UP504]